MAMIDSTKVSDSLEISHSQPFSIPVPPGSPESKLVLPDIKCYVLIATAILRFDDARMFKEMASRILLISSHGKLRFTNVINTLRLLLSFASYGLSLDMIAEALRALTPYEQHTSLEALVLTSIHTSLDNMVFLDAEIDPLDPLDSCLQASAEFNHTLDCLLVNGPTDITDTSLDYISSDPESMRSIIDETITWLQHQVGPIIDSMPVAALVATARDISAVASARCNARMYVPETSDLAVQSRSRFLRAMAAVVPLNRDPTVVLAPLMGICPEDLAWRAWARGQARTYARHLTADCRSDFSAFVAAAYKHPVQFNMLADQLDLSVPLFVARIAIPLARYHGNDFSPLMTWLFESGPHVGTPRQFQYYTECAAILTHKAVSSHAFVLFVSRYLAAIYFYAWQDRVAAGDFDEILRALHICANGLKHEISPYPVSEEWQVPSILDPIVHFETFVSFYDQPSNPLRPLFDAQTVANGVDCALAVVTACRQISKWHYMSLAQYLNVYLNTDPLLATNAAKSLIAHAVVVDDKSCQELLACASILADSHGPEGRITVSLAVYECLLRCHLYSAVSTICNDQSWPISAPTLFALLHDLLWLSLNHPNVATALSHANECLRLMDLVRPHLANDHAHQYSTLRSLLEVLPKLERFKVLIDRKAVGPPAVALHMRAFVHCAVDEQRNAVSVLVNTILSNNPSCYKQSHQLQQIAMGLLEYLAIPATTSVPEVASACVEAALADEDFEFAYSQALELAADPQAWITVYQVANFQPSGDDESTRDRTSRLLKQRDLLGRALSNVSETGATEAILRQWNALNREIEDFYTHKPPQECARDTMTTGTGTGNGSQDSRQSSALESGLLASLEHVGPSLYTAANPAGEKLQNFLILGLGWAIGAQRPH